MFIQIHVQSKNITLYYIVYIYTVCYKVQWFQDMMKANKYGGRPPFLEHRTDRNVPPKCVLLTQHALHSQPCWHCLSAEMIESTVDKGSFTPGHNTFNQSINKVYFKSDKGVRHTMHTLQTK